MYTKRCIDSQLDQLLPDLPAILLDGPKGVGKTYTALQRANTILRLDSPEQQAVVRSDLANATRGVEPILLDEWQMLPEVWGAVKRAVDEDVRGGRFLLTGSFPNLPTHSGAGRITTLRMRPMALLERGIGAAEVSLAKLARGTKDVSGRTDVDINQYINELVDSGFPGLRSGSDASRQLALSGYVQRVVDVDLPGEGVRVRKPELLLSWLKAYAAASSTTSSLETIRDAAGAGSGQTLSRSTIEPILDTLNRLRIVDDLPAWIPMGSDFVRLASLPKRYLADPALAANLLGYRKDDMLSGEAGDPNFDKYGPLIGRLFEALAVLSLRVYAETNFWKVSHFRERNGRREVDLIIEIGAGKVIAVEIKLTQTPRDSDFGDLLWLGDQLGERLVDSILITTGSQAYRAANGVAVVPLALIAP